MLTFSMFLKYQEPKEKNTKKQKNQEQKILNLKNVSIRGISDCNKDTLYCVCFGRSTKQQTKNPSKTIFNAIFFCIQNLFYSFCFLHFQFAARFFFISLQYYLVSTFY